MKGDEFNLNWKCPPCPASRMLIEHCVVRFLIEADWVPKTWLNNIKLAYVFIAMLTERITHFASFLRLLWMPNDLEERTISELIELVLRGPGHTLTFRLLVLTCDCRGYGWADFSFVFCICYASFRAHWVLCACFLHFLRFTSLHPTTKI